VGFILHDTGMTAADRDYLTAFALPDETSRAGCETLPSPHTQGGAAQHQGYVRSGPASAPTIGAVRCRTARIRLPLIAPPSCGTIGTNRARLPVGVENLILLVWQEAWRVSRDFFLVVSATKTRYSNGFHEIFDSQSEGRPVEARPAQGRWVMRCAASP
jgi:hypothetical protein